MTRSLISMAVIVGLCGCMKSLEDQTKKSDSSVFNKTTQDIGKFDPNAKNKVSDGKIKATDPVTAPLTAYGPMLEKVAQIQIQPAVNYFHAENDRYPKDYDEFMEVIIKANKIELPKLPGGKKYQYDEANHALVVVDGEAEAK